MTVLRIVTPNRWIGESTDTKPTLANEPRLRIGDTFFERNTGLLKITYDGTNWVVKDQISTLSTATGDALTDDTADALKSLLVDAAGTVIEKAEDAAHSSGDKGFMALGVRRDIASTLVSADGDYTPPQFDSQGSLRVTGGSALTDLKVVMEEVLLELKLLRLGHEVFDWEDEVSVEDLP